MANVRYLEFHFFFFERITFWHPLWAGLADSGYYMDVNIFTPLKRYVVTEQNATALLNQEPGGSAARGWGFDQQKMGKTCISHAEKQI